MKQKTFKEICKELKEKGFEVVFANVTYNGVKCYKINAYNSYGSLFTAKAVKKAYYDGEFI